MLQLQYLVNNDSEGKVLDHDLVELGIQSDNIHFVANDQKVLTRSGLHAASTIEETDMLHLGIRGALFGVITSVVFFVLLLVFRPIDWQASIVNYLAAFLLFTVLFSWLGGVIGLHFENYKISPFHQLLKQGKLVMLVYITNEQEQIVRRVMSKKHPEAQFLATREAIDNPFMSA
ncbi:hypothetical protein N7931_04045 [Catenovulum sp. 2E275]|uniref:hypothetical protein n=1 Tax=Catenovulum sp. 2E275 TaxID=2980497 RepID=UPI0021D22929|nr:hypothetical protein [Catenovulum sp. 2E275]MCU4674800.1 hypothetical protein [Catenovulum sp. 2E275]